MKLTKCKSSLLIFTVNIRTFTRCWRFYSVTESVQSFKDIFCRDVIRAWPSFSLVLHSLQVVNISRNYFNNLLQLAHIHLKKNIPLVSVTSCGSRAHDLIYSHTPPSYNIDVFAFVNEHIVYRIHVSNFLKIQI